MKKIVLILGFVVCFNIPVISAGELLWYLAASLSAPAKKVVSMYNQQNQQDKVLLIVGGSGQLLSKIQLSKKGDIYSPASSHYLEKCLTLSLAEKHRPFYMQTPVFGLSAKGVKKIKTFSDLSTPGIRISVGNPKTMALGRLYLRIEEKMDPIQAKAIQKNIILKALNVAQIANYLNKSLVDTGTIFNTVAIAHKIPYIEIPEKVNVLSETFWIELKFSQEKEAVKRFAEFVEKNSLVFKNFGFKKPIQ